MAEHVVFVVSEDARIRQAAALCLRQQLGANALPMAGGEPALAWATVLRPAVVLVDLTMADAGGAALVRWLREHRETGDLPVIGLVVDGPDGRDRALAAGCTDAASPTDWRDLARAVRACITRPVGTPALADA